MSLLTNRRRRVDPETAAAIARARAAETHAEVERTRALAELRREQAAADRAAAMETERDARRAKKEREAAREQERTEKRAKLNAQLAKLRTVLPLLIINATAVYGQATYAYYNVADKSWPQSVRIVFAVMFALASESVALYVQWHAHDALIQRSYATAAQLRRASWTIAALFAGTNYSHFADHGQPTPAAVIVGVFTLLSPWLWGLHTRRQQHVQLLTEDPGLIDDGGAAFSPERRRAFPVRSYMARRWSIDHGVRDPRAAWAGYNRERNARRSKRGRQHPAAPVEDLDQNTITMLAIIRLQARRARQAVGAGFLPSRRRAPVTQPDSGLANEADTKAPTAPDTAPDTAPAPNRTRRTTSRTTSDPTRRPDTASARVAKLRAKQPDIKQTDVARRLNITIRTVQRVWADTAPATKHDTREDNS